ncbi:histone chaperone [Polyrhizophydium stewartii]|uniref:Histone chaperone n=1 Tax=Polyrhizophydium stewartii TaxID=2732419 RepID=A0ABR4N4N5_9FUNG
MLIPKDVKRRIDALLNLQVRAATTHLEDVACRSAQKTDALDVQFRKELNELEKKYLALAQPVYDQRHSIIAGKHEPTDEEAKREDEDDDEMPTTDAAGVKGIPQFWLQALKNLPYISNTITEDDEPALAHLVDIKLEYLEKPGFKLTFYFTENEFFTNKTLTKTYFLEEAEDPSYGDVVFDHAEGTTIDWKEGKDLSTTVEIKKQRHKATNKTRTVKKTVPKETFFSFFSPPQMPDDEDEDEDAEANEEFEDLEERIQVDYEMGEAIKDKIIPKAIDWFTGKALDYEDQDEFDEFDEDGEDGEDDEEDDDDEAGGAAPGGAGDKPPECKQQ